MSKLTATRKAGPGLNVLKSSRWACLVAGEGEGDEEQEALSSNQSRPGFEELRPEGSSEGPCRVLPLSDGQGRLAQFRACPPRDPRPYTGGTGCSNRVRSFVCMLLNS